MTKTAPFSTLSALPSGWVYVVGDYVYVSQSATWWFILRDPSVGPWSYSLATDTWANLLVEGWNYIASQGFSPGTRYYYNQSTGYWYFLYFIPGALEYYNLATSTWGTLY